MDVIGHQAIGPNFSIGFSCRLGEQIPVKEIVVLFKEGLRTSITTLGNVVWVVRNDKARQANHR